jgi:N-acylneuraminate cytidylyltransferase
MALIPARAGSKRLHNKNNADLGGLPLWRHAVAHARASGACDMIVVSTNDPAIETDGSFHLLQRPDKLCTDEATTLSCVMHAHESMPYYDAICILQPSSPFRTGHDVARCIAMCGQPGVDSVVSVTHGPDDLVFLQRHANRLERLLKVLIPNGAIYVVKTSVLDCGGDWYGEYAYGYVMPKHRALDINVQWDLEVARQYLPNMRVA